MTMRTVFDQYFPMIIPHTDTMVKRAFDKASRLGSLNNSILSGSGNAAGYLGEEAVAAYMEADIVSSDRGSGKFDYDLILYDGTRAEVKTKRRTVPPRDFYDVSVAATSTHQKPDLYIFASVQFNRSGRINGQMAYGDLEAVWIVGCKKPDDFYREAHSLMPGDIDPDNNFVTTAAMFNLPIYRLEACYE